MNGSLSESPRGGNPVNKKQRNSGGLREFARQRRLGRNWQFYAMLLLPVAFYIIFCYAPMYGITIAFKDFKPIKGMWGSPWADPWYKYFMKYFESPYFFRTVSNTFTLSAMMLILGFPIPILLALMINEVSSMSYRKIVQNVTYAPHFLSTVVLVGLLTSFTNRDYGIVNLIIKAFGGTPDNWMQRPELFRGLYVGSALWQNSGWDSIIYIAALAGVDPQLHESAYIDGANRFQCIWHINVPSIMPTIVILLILNSGYIMNVGFEKVFLMQNSLNMAVSDVISTYVYRIALLESSQYSLSTAIGLFNSVINCLLLIIVNTISQKVGDTSLW